MSIYGKNSRKEGRAPAVTLWNPRFPFNVGNVVRAASCFGIEQVWFTGERVRLSMEEKKRLPREERMKGYSEVELRNYDHVFDQFDLSAVTPVAVELRPNAESLPSFEHPEHPLYVFGPEDGTLPQTVLRQCHRFVVIPTRHCVNLSAAVYLILYDRMVKTATTTLTIRDTLAESRFDFGPEEYYERLGLTMA